MYKKNACRHFRSETEYIAKAENKSYWKGGATTTRQYWCLVTMNTLGPDSRMVGDEDCTNRRSCFEEKSDE